MKTFNYEADLYSIENIEGILTQSPVLRDSGFFVPIKSLSVQDKIFAVMTKTKIYILTALKLHDDEYKIFVYNKSQNEFKITDKNKFLSGYEFVGTVLDTIENLKLPL